MNRQILSSEAAVLGCCMANPQAYWRVADLLTASDFGDPRMSRLYAMITERANAKKPLPFDAVTICEVDHDLGSFALDLANSDGWRQANVRAYAEIVARGAVSRKVKIAGQQIARLDGDDILGQAQQLLGACLPRHTGEVKHIRDYVRASVAELQRRVNEKGAMTGIPTSIPDLDDLTGGWQNGDLIVLAARPSVGKTAFAIQSLVNAARHQKRSLFFSLEMTGVKIADRIQAHIAQVNLAGMKRPELFDNADFGALFAAAAEVSELPLHIDQTPGLSLEALGARARQHKAMHGLDMIAVDYFQLMTPPKASTRNEALAMVSGGLKGLAKELDVPLILLSQLNREGEGQRPGLSNLRDTGALEQDADVVMMLHRPDTAKREHVIGILAKQRDGETGDIHFHANMRHQRFTAIEEPAHAEQQQSHGFGGMRRARKSSAGGWNGYND